MLMQATPTLSEFLGLRVTSGLYLFQSSSIAAASAILSVVCGPKNASEASKKTLNLPFSILQWSAKLFFVWPSFGLFQSLWQLWPFVVPGTYVSRGFHLRRGLVMCSVFIGYGSHRFYLWPL
jgi:prolipoprotein diacylglyceryltransferase